MEEIIGHGIYHSKKPCDRTSSPASDMQSQRKAGQHSKERKEGRNEREKKRGGEKKQLKGKQRRPQARPTSPGSRRAAGWAA